MTRPVVPIDPAGNLTDRLGTHGEGGRVGPPGWAAPIVEPPPELSAQPHSYPVSDVMNWPGAVAEMTKPSTSATLIAGTRWITEVNVVGDADGLPTPYDRRFDDFIPVPNMAMFTTPYLRNPNQSSGVPQGVKMSVISNNFATFLRRIQGHLLGSP